ncbi:MAG TPA: trypsin-like peptidase domain-containing protein [Polyangiaceae bacterium]|nr:trypsin-like peptidase domain-containing protein [Polyangiaceae bacterium]
MVATRSLVAVSTGAVLALLTTLLACKRSAGAPDPTPSAPPGAAAAQRPSGSPLPLATLPPSNLVPPSNVQPLSAFAPIEDERNTISVFRETAASAVFVTQTQVVVDYWAGQRMEVPAGSGSGFVWDKEGHVVTNFHVIQNARSLTVTLQDQSTLEATVVGAEPRKDIAVLKVNAPADKLVPIRLHDPKAFRLEVGQKAIAIGNPFGLDHTLTVGIISALNRAVDGVGGVQIRDMVQTDAAINPGNSGGPLLDSGGRLIGMNTAIFSKSGVSAGVGFAVPASTISRIVPQLIRTGRAEQVGIGINIDPSGNLERRAGIRGVIVLSVPDGSAAAKAGLRGVERSRRGLSLGDVIVGIDQAPINDYDDLYNTLDKYQAGQKVKLKVRRENQTVELTVELKPIQ